MEGFGEMTYEELVKEWERAYCDPLERKSFNDWIAERVTRTENDLVNWRRQCLEADAMQNRRNDAARRFFDRIREISHKYKFINTLLLGVTMSEFEDEMFPKSFGEAK